MLKRIKKNYIHIENAASYNHLRIFVCSVFYHVSAGKLVPTAKKGYFQGYPSGVKGVRIWCPEERKCIISRDVKFNEVELFKACVNSNDQINDQKELESFELEVEHAGKGEIQAEISQVEDVQTNQNNTSNDQTDLNGYLLARDRERRIIKQPQRCAQADMISYAFQIVEEVCNEEPASFEEAVKGKENEQWMIAMT